MERQSIRTLRYENLSPFQRKQRTAEAKIVTARQLTADVNTDDAKKVAAPAVIAERPVALSAEELERARELRQVQAEEEAMREYNSRQQQIQRFDFYQAVLDNFVNVYIEKENPDENIAQEYVDTLNSVFEVARKELCENMVSDH